MRKQVLILLALIGCLHATAQCLVSTLDISTGYNPATGYKITPGVYAGIPVPDPHWIVTGVSPSVAVAIALTGLTEVTVGSNADIITPAGSWVANPVLDPGGWISCINGDQYTTDGTGTKGTKYNMTLGRPFRMCSADSIVLDFYIANDNYMPATDIDGVPLLFSQPAIAVTSNFTMFTHFSQTVFLTAGTHILHTEVDNYNDPTVEVNPTGLDLYGSVSSKTGINSLVYEGDSACNVYVCGYEPTTNCDSIIMPDTLSACIGSFDTIPAHISGPDSVLSVLWTDSTRLSDTSVIDPVYHFGATSVWKYVTLQALIPVNLVVNGDFSAGNSGFTSSYIYSPPPSTILVEGDYSVYTDPHGVHSGFTSFGDHTTGTGNMMILNGASSPVDVWCETIDVEPNTNYDFSAWFANCSAVTIPPDVPTLQFRINGILQGVPTTVTTGVGVWVNFSTTWNSGTSTTATICIYDSQTSTSGNDFVIDDISFEPICESTDSIYLQTIVPDTAYSSKDTSVCTSVGAVTLLAPAGYSSYIWSTGSTATSIVVTKKGDYRVYASTACNVQVDTFKVSFIISPFISLGNDTSFCTGNSLTLKSIQPAGYTFLWNTGSTADSVNASVSGTYQLTVNNNGCITTDSIHVTVSPFPIVDLGPDTLNCQGDPVTLQSSYTYTGPDYLWSDGDITPATVATTSGAYWLQVTVAGCSGADTINVAILWDTLNFFNHDTAICRGDTMQVHTTGNPGLTYQWVPTAGIPASATGNPMIVADTSALYVMTASMARCPDIVDSFYLDVQPNPSVYISQYRSVCQFDTLRIIASVSPEWYTHYSYNWSPSTYLDNSNTSAVVFTPGDKTNLVLTVTTPAGCKGIDSTQIAVYPGNFISLDTTVVVCPHDSVQVVPNGGIAYNWRPGTYLSDSLAAAPWIRAIKSIDYTVIAYSEFGCRDTGSVKVIVGPAADMYLADSVTLYPGESYQISPQTNCSYFTWFPPQGLDNANISNPVAMPEVNTRYIVNAATEWGCKITDSIDVYIDAGTLLALPNAFSPGNGPNAEFKIIKNGIATLDYFRIYNRWGNMVFETSDINAGWDGTYKGVAQPFDVYVYEIEAITSDGKIFTKHGNVTLVR